MDDSSLAGRVALLTGASGGIGGALARRLIAAGVRVALGYGRHSAQAEQLVAEARAAGVGALALGGDLAQPATAGRLVESTTSVLGPIDLLLANAGDAVRREYGEVDLATWDRTLSVNLRAPFQLAQAVLPGMVSRGFGRVLFVSSVAAFTGGVVGPHYAASKAGLHGLTHFLALRTAADGVTVNALAPALIEDTAMLPRAPDGGPALRIPVGRYGRPEEVADLGMAMLRNGYLTNQVVSIDGGMYAR